MFPYSESISTKEKTWGHFAYSVNVRFFWFIYLFIYYYFKYYLEALEG